MTLLNHKALQDPIFCKQCQTTPYKLGHRLLYKRQGILCLPMPTLTPAMTTAITDPYNMTKM